MQMSRIRAGHLGGICKRPSPAPTTVGWQLQRVLQNSALSSENRKSTIEVASANPPHQLYA